MLKIMKRLEAGVSLFLLNARVAELVDALDLKSSGQ
jgi:hypothetical protein